MGANVKEFLHLVEEFVNMVGLQMGGFQDIYEVTENLGEPPPHPNSPQPTPPHWGWLSVVAGCEQNSWFITDDITEDIQLDMKADSTTACIGHS